MFLFFSLVALTLRKLYTMFNPEDFLNSSISEANDTKVIPVPVGEYPAIINKAEARIWQSKDGTQSGISLDVLWSIEDAQVKAELDRSEVLCKQGIMLDTTPEGKLDTSKGKNIGLGRLREAVGLNTPGQTFSFQQLPGQSAKVTVKHRIVGEDTYAEVKAVTRM